VVTGNHPQGVHAASMHHLWFREMTSGSNHLACPSATTRDLFPSLVAALASSIQLYYSGLQSGTEPPMCLFVVVMRWWAGLLQCHARHPCVPSCRDAETGVWIHIPSSVSLQSLVSPAEGRWSWSSATHLIVLDLQAQRVSLCFSSTMPATVA